ncbi:hypothetical protein TEA_020013 [Camellia sinensis var. sinensis]|uniref:PRONE domain-containing protein n=1 Tax=Camellia sinensis var. sinensis TaxID=542762 RepID=A0A4V3WQ19_CAMSN|nr:hypothetical protein TEA_020013 [Camellia sinensis var. sinensis]
MMIMMRRRLACCNRDAKISLDFDEQERIMTYNGLESCILNSHSYENESGASRADGCATDSLDEDASSCSSSNNASGSVSYHWTMMKRDEQGLDEWEVTESPLHLYVKEKPVYSVQFSDVETMKERFAKLLLGEDTTGGRKGLSTALALSNAITNLAASVFGELWKLEPLPEERKRKWRREMDWLLSPTNYMVELVPAKQHGANGRTMEIMTPKARADIHMNLPALQKLDSMLIEMLDSMVSAEFSYAEGCSQAEGRSRRWWLPLPQVPTTGLSEIERKKLLKQGKVVHQSAKAGLGEELYRILSAESKSSEEMLNSLNWKSEHSALETINRLEAAIFAWKERITEQACDKSPVRTSWSFIKSPTSELEKMEVLLDQAEALIQQLKIRHPNLPQTFLDVVKIQYGKDVGHSILEAYSRVLQNLAFKILSRIGDVLQEDVLSNPNSPVSTYSFPGMNFTGNSDSRGFSHRVVQSLTEKMSKVDGQLCNSSPRFASDLELSCSEPKTSSVTATPSRSQVWCIGSGVPPQNSP